MRGRALRFPSLTADSFLHSDLGGSMLEVLVLTLNSHISITITIISYIFFILPFHIYYMILSTSI